MADALELVVPNAPYHALRTLLAVLFQVIATDKEVSLGWHSKVLNLASHIIEHLFNQRPVEPKLVGSSVPKQRDRVAAVGFGLSASKLFAARSCPHIRTLFAIDKAQGLLILLPYLLDVFPEQVLHKAELVLEYGL